MSRCTLCNKDLSPYNESSKKLVIEVSGFKMEVCRSCTDAAGGEDGVRLKLSGAIEEAQKQDELNAEQQRVFDSMIVTTTSEIQGKPVVEYLGIVGSQTMQGINVFKDLFAQVRNVVGGRSSSLQKAMKDMREIAVNELKTESFALGANAIVGVKLDFDEYSEGMLMLSATGTAVRV